MKSEAEQLLEDITVTGEVCLETPYDEDSMGCGWRIYNSLLDLYFLKFGMNLRLTNESVKETIRLWNEIHGK